MPNHVSGNRDATSLQIVSTVYGEEAERRRKAGQRHQGYELISEIAAFKARAQNLAAKRRKKEVQRRRANQMTSFLFSGRFWELQDFEICQDVGQAQSASLKLAMDRKELSTRYIVSLESSDFARGPISR